MVKHVLSKWAATAFLGLLLALFAACGSVFGNPPAFQADDLDEIEKEINAYIPDPHYEDDPFIVVTIQEGIEAKRKYNGGIGACLVREAAGEVVERGHNRQNTPYFQSSLHAEMDLLDRYEGRTRDIGSYPGDDQRKKKEGLVLYTSLEPCPMCMTRIINSGVKKVYYAVNDESGGMAHLLGNLPPFWQNMAQGMVIEPAKCSPYLRIIAERLFPPLPKSCVNCNGNKS